MVCITSRTCTGTQRDPESLVARTRNTGHTCQAGYRPPVCAPMQGATPDPSVEGSLSRGRITSGLKIQRRHIQLPRAGEDRAALPLEIGTRSCCPADTPARADCLFRSLRVGLGIPGADIVSGRCPRVNSLCGLNPGFFGHLLFRSHLTPFRDDRNPLLIDLCLPFRHLHVRSLHLPLLLLQLFSGLSDPGPLCIDLRQLFPHQAIDKRSGDCQKSFR